MKRKNFFWMFGLCAAMLLSACSQDETVNNNVIDDTDGQTCFTSVAPDGTRTSMDAAGKFYWTQGDHIFVKNGSTYVKSTNAASSKMERENFYMAGTYTADSYPVVYTGNGETTTATSVTIKATQEQLIANDATHIGTDGDCGNATATKKTTGTYSFDLKHCASYLVITPRHSLSGEVKVTKVVVTSSGSDNLCGTYTNFSENATTLKGLTTTNGGKSVTLNTGTGTDGWAVPEAAESDLDGVRGFMVIQPGTHTLTFTYHVTVNGTERQFVKTVPSRDFNAGNFTNVKHILADVLLFDGKYYQWGATETWPSTNPSYSYDQTTIAPTQLTMTSPVAWGELPNANELYSYIAYGDPRWDSETVWSSDGGLTERTGGIWLKKRSAIGSQFSSEKGVNGVDMRAGAMYYHYVFNSNAGKPADNVIGQYFFLPALGAYFNRLEGLGEYGYYWSRSPCPGDGGSYAYGLIFDHYSVRIESGTGRNFGFVVAPQWFK